MAKSIPKSKTKAGFTVIEVTLFLAVTGLILVGVLGGTYSSIATQRYNDSVRSFAEFLRQLYGEAISPESIGQADDNASTGDSDNYAIYGKIAVFGLDTDNAGRDYGSKPLNGDEETRVYTATVVGNTSLKNSGGDFESQLAEAQVSLYCGSKSGDTDISNTTLGSYTPLWGAHLLATTDEASNKKLGKPFTGTVLIARSPASGVIHTAFINKTFDLKTQCDAASGATGASTTFHDTIQALAGNGTLILDPGTKMDTTDPIGFCIESDNSNAVREVRISADGRNTSAVSILNADVEENGVEASRCAR